MPRSWCQGSEGQVYLVSTSTAVATLFASYPDVPGSDAFSPNGLGYNGNVFNTSFVNSASNLTLYRNGVALVQPLATTSQPSGTAVGIAAGDVSGNTYYYIDTDFDLYSVSNINGATRSNVKIMDEMTGATGLFGDLAISGGSMVVSYGTNSLQQFDLNGNLLNTITNETRRYLGLAFDGGVLYGVVDTGSTNDLYPPGDHRHERRVVPRGHDQAERQFGPDLDRRSFGAAACGCVAAVVRPRRIWIRGATANRGLKSGSNVCPRNPAAAGFLLLA